MTQTAAPERIASDLPRYDNAQAWYGPDMAKRDDWIHAFTADELADIDRAVRHAEASGRDIADLRAPDFPLGEPMRALLDRMLAQAGCPDAPVLEAPAAMPPRFDVPRIYADIARLEALGTALAEADGRRSR